MAPDSKPGKAVSVYQETRDQLQNVEAEIKASLPEQIPVNRFIRSAAWAVQASPQLQQCSPRSIVAACLRAAHDGLLPDGREGALVAYKAKQPDGRYAMTAQWLPMVAGIRKKVFNAKLLSKWDVQVVQEGDHIDYQLGSHPQVIHKPSMRGGRTRKVIAAYSIATFPDGSQTIEFMNQDQLADVAAKSRAQHGPWQDPVFYPEMCRKTVAKLHAKQLPTSSDIEGIFRREDAQVAELAAAADRATPIAPTSTREALQKFAPSEPEEPEDESEPRSTEQSDQATNPETTQGRRANEASEADESFPGDELPLEESQKREDDPHIGSEPSKQPPPKQSNARTPRNAAEYTTYYRQMRDRTTGKAGSAMLKRWFYSGEQNELRAVCNVNTAELEADLRKYIDNLK